MNEKDTAFGSSASHRVPLAPPYCAHYPRLWRGEDAIRTARAYPMRRLRSLTANLYPKSDAISFATANELETLTQAVLIAWGVVSGGRPEGSCPGTTTASPMVPPCVHVRKVRHQETKGTENISLGGNGLPARPDGGTNPVGTITCPPSYRSSNEYVRCFSCGRQMK